MDKNEEVSLKQVFNLLLKKKWQILGLTAVIALVSVVIAIRLPNIYKSEALLAPTTESSGINLPGQLGGLASLAGVDIGGGNSGSTVLALELLKSRYFVSKFIEKHELAIALFGANGWDSATDSLKYDSSIYDQKTNTWVREVKWPRGAEPSKQELYEEFLDIFQVIIDDDSGYVTISVEHFSPYLAKVWVSLLVQDINDEMKDREMKQAEKSIEFLTEQVKNTDIADAKSMMYSLIEEQVKTLMLANSRDEFAFKTVDPAVVAEQKHKPQRVLIVILSVLMGLMLSLIFVLTKLFVNPSSIN